MQHRPFGPTGRDVSVVGQGTWYIDNADRSQAVAALRRGLDLGMSHIDTAEMYGDAELVVAEAVESRRQEAFLVSKVLPNHATARGVVEACERSLRRLRTDRLDVYLLHWRGGVPLAETVAGMARLVEAGKIAAWGVSNFDEDDLEELWSECDGAPAPVCNQVLYHLQERAIEHAVIPWCEAHRLATVAYSPFGHDDFPSPASPGGRVLAEIAAAHDAAPRQVALAFLTRRPSLFAIPKAADARHVESNAAAGDLQLREAEIARLEQAFPLGRKPRSLPMI